MSDITINEKPKCYRLNNLRFCWCPGKIKINKKLLKMVTAFLLKMVMDTNSITCLRNNIETHLYLNLL